MTFGWQEKIFSPSEEQYFQKAKEDDFQGNVLKKKYYKDIQEAKKRSKKLGQKIFTCLDGELYENEEVRKILNMIIFSVCQKVQKVLHYFGPKGFTEKLYKKAHFIILCTKNSKLL